MLLFFARFVFFVVDMSSLAHRVVCMKAKAARARDESWCSVVETGDGMSSAAGRASGKAMSSMAGNESGKRSWSWSQISRKKRSSKCGARVAEGSTDVTAAVCAGSSTALWRRDPAPAGASGDEEGGMTAGSASAPAVVGTPSIDLTAAGVEAGGSMRITVGVGVATAAATGSSAGAATANSASRLGGRTGGRTVLEGGRILGGLRVMVTGRAGLVDATGGAAATGGTRWTSDGVNVDGSARCSSSSKIKVAEPRLF